MVRRSCIWIEIASGRSAWTRQAASFAPALQALVPVRSLEGGQRVNGIAQLAVSSDGSRIYYQQPVEQPDSDVIHVKTGWAAAAPP